jgi:hypothetical protein
MFLQVLNLIKQLTFNIVLIFAYICDKWFIGTSYCLMNYLLLNSQLHITQKSFPPFFFLFIDNLTTHLQSCLSKQNCHLPFSSFFPILHNFHSPAHNHAFPFPSAQRHFSFISRQVYNANEPCPTPLPPCSSFLYYILPFNLFLLNYTPIDATTQMLVQYSPSPLSVPKTHRLTLMLLCCHS